jgi:hypothetical protein
MDEEKINNQKDEIKELMEKNLALTEEIYKMTKKIKAYVNFQKVMSFIYFLLIVVPIILGIIFLPPLLSGVIKQYQDLLGSDTTGNVNDLLKSLPEQLKSQIKVLPK